MKKISVFFLLILFSTTFPQGITLRDTTNQFDYIIVTIPEFVQSCQAFKQHKESYNGFNVLIVDTGQIYNEFNSDSLPQNNIREFISYAGTYWQNPKLKYVLLVGTNNKIPGFELPLPVPPFSSYHKTDYFYGINIESIDTLTIEYLIGRIPAKNNNEILNYFTKLIQYENISFIQEWFNSCLFIYESEDMFRFKDFSYLLSSQLPDNINCKFFTNIDTSNDFGNKDSIINYLNNDGASILIYEGHTDDSTIINSGYFNVSNVNDLNNSGKYYFSIFTGGQYSITDTNSNILSEMLMKENGGSIASIGSSGLVYWVTLTDIHEYWINKLYSSNNLTLGELLRLYNFPNYGSYYYMRKAMNFLGDPSLKLKYDPTVDVKETKTEIINDFVLNSNFPNPFNPSTKIRWQSPVSGWQTLKVYDVLGNEVETLVDEFKPAGKYEVEFNALKLSSGIYFYTLRSGDFVQTKKMILLK